MMQELFASGRVVDLIIVFMALEVGVLIAYRRTSGRGLDLYKIFGLMLPGLFLLLALRAALVAGSWPIIAACLLVSLLFHLADLAGRWRSSSGR